MGSPPYKNNLLALPSPFSLVLRPLLRLNLLSLPIFAHFLINTASAHILSVSLSACDDEAQHYERKEGEKRRKNGFMSSPLSSPRSFTSLLCVDSSLNSLAHIHVLYLHTSAFTAKKSHQKLCFTDGASLVKTRQSERHSLLSQTRPRPQRRL